MIDNGGAAFPRNDRMTHDESLIYQEQGMTLRDWFAGQALAGYLAAGSDDAKTAAAAYWHSDNMLKARRET